MAAVNPCCEMYRILLFKRVRSSKIWINLLLIKMKSVGKCNIFVRKGRMASRNVFYELGTCVSSHVLHGG